MVIVLDPNVTVAEVELHPTKQVKSGGDSVKVRVEAMLMVK